MNALTLKTPPAPPLSDRPEYLVAVRIKLVTFGPGLFPDHNFIGTRLFNMVCRAVLRERGLLAQDVEIPSGYFNDSYHIFKVTSVGPALSELEAILKSINLRNVSTLLFHKFDRFQPWGLDGAGVGIGMTFADMAAEMERVQTYNAQVIEHNEQVTARLKALLSLFQSRRENDGDQPPPAPPIQ